MNTDFDDIKSVLISVRDQYASQCEIGSIDEHAPITERDIVSNIYCELRRKFLGTALCVHSEVKPASSEMAVDTELKGLPKVDVAILSDVQGRRWIDSAIAIQNRYKKGIIEARFSSVPLEFFHTAIEVKIQSNVRDAKKDINMLQGVVKANKSCNAFFVLLNARGRVADHEKIKSHAADKCICIIEYTCSLPKY